MHTDAHEHASSRRPRHRCASTDMVRTPTPASLRLAYNCGAWFGRTARAHSESVDTVNTGRGGERSSARPLPLPATRWQRAIARPPVHRSPRMAPPSEAPVTEPQSRHGVAALFGARSLKVGQLVQDATDRRLHVLELPRHRHLAVIRPRLRLGRNVDVRARVHRTQLFDPGA
eukprot:2238401-Prymnesium_polylepis.1